MRYLEHLFVEILPIIIYSLLKYSTYNQSPV